MRRLIVNADDFGQTRAITEGIVAAHTGGIVTSASLMVRGAAVDLARDASQSHPALGVGLHIDLGEWMYAGDEWHPLYQVVPIDDASGVEEEVRRQIDAFVRMMGRVPTHIDSHQHVHRREPVRGVALGVARELGVPLRHFTPQVTYCGAFYGQTERGEPWPEGIAAGHLVRLISELSPGTTELACHPGFGAGGRSMYDIERSAELQVLRDARVADAIRQAGVRLITFADL